MNRKLAAAALALGGLLGLSSSAFAWGPSTFKIKRIVHAGTGCPAGTVAENVASDNSAFTLLFDSFVAEAGAGVPLSAGRKNCQLNIEFECPAGWQFALVDLDTRGYAALDWGVKGIQKTSFYFQGDARTGSFDRTFYGPLSYDYHVRDTLPVSSRVYGVCGRSARSLNVNVQVRLDNLSNRYGNGLMTVDSLDGQLAQVFALDWRRE